MAYILIISLCRLFTHCFDIQVVSRDILQFPAGINMHSHVSLVIMRVGISKRPAPLISSCSTSVSWERQVQSKSTNSCYMAYEQMENKQIKKLWNLTMISVAICEFWCSAVTNECIVRSVDRK